MERTTATKQTAAEKIAELYTRTMSLPKEQIDRVVEMFGYLDAYREGKLSEDETLRKLNQFPKEDLSVAADIVNVFSEL